MGDIGIKKADLYNYYDKDAGKYIKKLINFLGEPQVLRSLKKYEQSLKSSSKRTAESFL